MKYRTLAAVAALMLMTGAHADEAAVRSTVQRMFPDSEASLIAKTPVPGRLEVAVGGQVFYVTEDGGHVLGGPLIDTRSRRNLTETRLAQINKIPFDRLNMPGFNQSSQRLRVSLIAAVFGTPRLAIASRGVSAVDC